jgi:hypothetical protein
MTSHRISEFPAVTTVESADEYLLQRAGDTKKITDSTTFRQQRTLL